MIRGNKELKSFWLILLVENQQMLGQFDLDHLVICQDFTCARTQVDEADKETNRK